MRAGRLRACRRFVLPSSRRSASFCATRRATRANLRGFPKDSRYSNTTSVLRIVFPVLEQVVRRDVRLVADGHEGRKPEALLGCALQQREPERAALGGEADLARRKRARSERRVQSNVRDSYAEAVWSEQPGAVRRAPARAEGRWRASPSGPISAKPAEITQRARTPAARASSAASSTALAGQADDREIDGLSDLGDAPVSPDARDRLARAVDGIGDTAELAAQARCGRAHRRSSPDAMMRRRPQPPPV